MTERRPRRDPQRPPPDSWRIERMVQRVPGHLGEDTTVSPWLLIGAVVLVILIGCVLLFVWGGGGQTNAAARTATSTVARPSEPPATAPVTPSVTPTLAPTPVPVKYTVKKGDTLSSIAIRYKVTVESIRAANNLTSDTIREGDVLIIPSATPTPPPQPRGTNTPLTLATPTLIAFRSTATPLISPTPSPTPGVVIYVVKPGDTLLAIATTYSTTVSVLIDVNHLTGPDIRAGQTLTVPVGAWTPTATVSAAQQRLPTLTPTPNLSYPAPVLIWPPDAKEFASGETIQLAWLAAGSLKNGEEYVMNVVTQCGNLSTPLQFPPVTQGTVFTLTERPNCAGPVQFRWYVVVVREGGCPGRTATNQPCALSPISEIRTFTWN